MAGFDSTLFPIFFVEDATPPVVPDIPNNTLLGNNIGVPGPVLTLTKTQAQSLLEIDYVVQSRNTAAPNATVPVHALTAVGSENDVDLVISPKGKGGISASVANNLATGGDKRGQYAVDFQTVRQFSSQVASGKYSLVLGGFNNTASGEKSFTVGGSNQTVTGSSSFLVGSATSTIYGTGFIVGGANHAITGTESFIIGGTSNAASATYGGMVGGASGSASGSYSSVIMSSDSDALGGGIVLGGVSNYANIGATVAGAGCTASAMRAFAFGTSALCGTEGGWATGKEASNSGPFYSQVHSAGKLVTVGDNQVRRAQLRGITTVANPVQPLKAASSGIASGVGIALLSKSAACVKAVVVVTEKGGVGGSAIFEFTAHMIKTGTTAATCALVAPVVPVLVSSVGVGSGFTLSVTMDNVTDGVLVVSGGSTGYNAAWLCSLEITEIAYV